MKNFDKTTLVGPYIGFLAVAAFAAFGYSALRLSSVDPVMVGLLVGISAVAQRLPVFLFKSSAISVSFAAVIASYVLYGTGVALLVNLASCLVNAFTPTRKPFKKMAFNTANLTLSAFLAAEAYKLFGGQVPPTSIPQSVVAVALSASI